MKRVLPEVKTFEREHDSVYVYKFGHWGNDGSLKEEIVYDGGPIIKIVAVYDATDKPTNKVDYILGVYTHRPLRAVINPILGLQSQNTEKDTFIVTKSFKTLEDAEKYNEKNKARLIKEYVPKIESLMSEIQSAEEDFGKVFDFRLLNGERFAGDYRDGPIRSLAPLKATWN